MSRLCGPCVVYALVIAVLSIVALAGTGACIALSFREVPIPPLLAGLTTSALSALAGMLAPSPWVVWGRGGGERPST